MKILVFAGSTSSKSINFQLATYASTFFEDAKKKIVNLSEMDIPLFDIDRKEADGIPDSIMNFASEISKCDFIILSLAEHNGHYAAAFKSLYDWISLIPERKVWDGKPIFLLSTSPGGRGGASVMSIALDRFPRDGAQIIENFSLPSFYENFDSESKKITNDNLLSDFQKVTEKVKLFVKKKNS